MANLKSILISKNSLYLLSGFILIRVLSFFLKDQLIVQGILAFVILMIFGGVFYKKPVYAWLFLVTEFLLGGTGHLLELGGLSLRTLLVLAFLAMWYMQTIAKRDTLKHIKELSPVSYILMALLIYIWFSGINGLIHGHEFNAIVQDTIPYFFFFLIPPAVHFLQEKKYYKYYIRLVVAFIIGSAIFSALTYVFFSGGIVHLQEPYYKWFRDVVNGKITNLGNGFWRVVSPEHLLLTPIILIVSSFLMRVYGHTDLTDRTDLKRTCLLAGRSVFTKLKNFVRVSFFNSRKNVWAPWFLLFSLLLVFVLNLSRTYILGLLIGLVVLKYKHTWKSWFYVSGVTVLGIIVLFTGIHFVSSGFTSPGWDLFGVRISSVARPSIERSSATRKVLLEPIINKIRENPLLGSGLGSTISFSDLPAPTLSAESVSLAHRTGRQGPVTRDIIVTRQYDWGYLEMWAELGFVGLGLFTVLLLFILFRLLKKIKKHESAFHIGLLASLVSLLAMNVTTPLLFHVFGVLFLVFVIGVRK